LHALDRIEHGDRAVEHAQRALDLHREVDVAGRVDQVDDVVLPAKRGRRRGDRDPALLLLLHPVGDGGALVDIAEPGRDPGVVQDALGRRGLARVDVRHDPDVAGAQQRNAAGGGLVHGVFERNQRRGARTRRGCLLEAPGLRRAAVIFMSSVV